MDDACIAHCAAREGGFHDGDDGMGCGSCGPDRAGRDGDCRTGPGRAGPGRAAVMTPQCTALRKAGRFLAMPACHNITTPFPLLPACVFLNASLFSPFFSGPCLFFVRVASRRAAPVLLYSSPKKLLLNIKELRCAAGVHRIARPSRFQSVCVCVWMCVDARVSAAANMTCATAKVSDRIQAGLEADLV